MNLNLIKTETFKTVEGREITKNIYEIKGYYVTHYVEYNDFSIRKIDSLDPYKPELNYSDNYFYNRKPCFSMQTYTYCFDINGIGNLNYFMERLKEAAEVIKILTDKFL